MTWKNRKVLLFEWKEYYGYIPKQTGFVVEETDKEVLVSVFFKKIWTKKKKEIPESTVCGFAKLLI